MRRWLLLLIAAAVLIAGFFGVRAFIRSRAGTALANLQTVEATTGNLTALVGATGAVRANQSAVLTFQSTGTVERVNVEIGDTVRADQVLAALEPSSLPASILLSQADLVSSQRALDSLQNSSLAQAQAQLAIAQAQDALRTAEYNRTVQQQGNRANRETIETARARVLLAQGRFAEVQDYYNQVSGLPETNPVRALALTNLASARAELRSTERSLDWYNGGPSEIQQAMLDANVAIAEAQLADAQREWERLRDGPDSEDIAAAEARVAAAQASANMARIAAPFAGTITRVDVMPGDQVAPGTVAFGLADLSQLLVDVEVSEIDIDRVRPGQTVTLTLDAVLARTYQGTVTGVGLTGNAVQGVVNFPVTVEILDADASVRPGMTAAVNIVVDQIENVLVIPNRAVRVQDSQRVVYVLRNGVPQAVPVVLGASSDTNSQVLEGEVQAGDLIVLNPPLQLGPGAGGGPGSFFGQ